MKRQIAKFRLNGRHEIVLSDRYKKLNLKERRERDRVKDKNPQAEERTCRRLYKRKYCRAPLPESLRK